MVMEEWPKVRTRPNSRDFHHVHEYTRVQENVLNVAIVLSTRAVLLCATVGEKNGRNNWNRNLKVKRFNLNKARLLSGPVSILPEK